MEHVLDCASTDGALYIGLWPLLKYSSHDSASQVTASFSRQFPFSSIRVP